MKIISTLLTLLYAVQASTASAADDKEEWLKLHNDLRFKYHTANSKTVVNLKWSTGLAALAKTWAEGNAEQCKNREGNDGGFGRNGVLHQGTTTGLTPEWALNNWEKKKALGYPGNAALTQAVWRSTEYVGCYTSENDATSCESAVCYYAKPGNCGMGGAVGTDAGSVAVWKEKVFADSSQKNNCGNLCPPEGCPDDGSTIPITTISFRVPTRRPNRKPNRRNASVTKSIGNKISCNWSPTFENADNHKQACMAANDEYTVPYTCDGELTNVCCTVSGIVNTTFDNKKFGTCLKNGATGKPTRKLTRMPTKN